MSLSIQTRMLQLRLSAQEIRQAPPPTRRATSRTTARKAPAGNDDLIVETIEALLAERGEGDKIWGSMVKQALKRRKPGFNESYCFKSFSDLLEEAPTRQLLKLERDEKSGGYIIRVVGEVAEGLH